MQWYYIVDELAYAVQIAVVAVIDGDPFRQGIRGGEAIVAIERQERVVCMVDVVGGRAVRQRRILDDCGSGFGARVEHLDP